MPKLDRTANNKALSYFVPFLWLFFITIQIKIDNQEAFVPFFRILIFITLPFALISIFRSFSATRGYAIRSWLILSCVAYLLIYPVVTILFTDLDIRNTKDAAYTVSIFIVLAFLVKRYFTNHLGEIDVQSLGWFIVTFAIIESIIAVALHLGLEMSFGYGIQFKQVIWLDGRLHGLLGTPSHLGPVVAVACLFLMTQTLNINRMLMFSFLLMILAMTGSRGSLLGFIGGLGLFLLHWTKFRRFRLKTLYMIILSVVVFAGVILYNLETAEQVLQIATRSDHNQGDKNRLVMWDLRLSEFYQYDFLSLVFGKGHRMVDQTFNINVEILTSYGIFYFVVFNIYYVLMLFYFLSRAFQDRDPSNLFILMIAIFFYLFSQGINYMHYQFVHIFQLFIVVMVTSYINRNAFMSRLQGSRSEILSSSAFDGCRS